MRKLLFGLFALGLANICNAQTTDPKKETKLPPPAIEKNKEVKFTPPRIKKTSEAKGTAPRVEKVKFKAPRKSTKRVKNSHESKLAPPVVEEKIKN